MDEFLDTKLTYIRISEVYSCKVAKSSPKKKKLSLCIKKKPKTLIEPWFYKPLKQIVELGLQILDRDHIDIGLFFS